MTEDICASRSFHMGTHAEEEANAQEELDEEARLETLELGLAGGCNLLYSLCMGRANM